MKKIIFILLLFSFFGFSQKEYKFDHFKNIDEVMYYLNYWYNEEDAYSINRYLSLKDFNYYLQNYFLDSDRLLLSHFRRLFQKRNPAQL